MANYVLESFGKLKILFVLNGIRTHYLQVCSEPTALRCKMFISINNTTQSEGITLLVSNDLSN